VVLRRLAGTDPASPRRLASALVERVLSPRAAAGARRRPWPPGHDAVDVCRALAATDPRYRPLPRRLLPDLATDLAESDRTEATPATAREAVGLLRHLVDTGNDACPTWPKLCGSVRKA